MEYLELIKNIVGVIGFAILGMLFILAFSKNIDNSFIKKNATYIGIILGLFIGIAVFL